MSRIVVIGTGVGGLGTALCAARSGHTVTLIERDDTPLPADPRGAFDWDRRGAPQVRHSHAFLARLRNLLRDRHPDLLASLLDAGATEIRFLDTPPVGMEITPEPADEELVALACRRTTFEWVLRRAALAEGGVELLHGTTVSSLVAASERHDGLPVIVGVRLADGTGPEDGTVIEADVVVASGGRRIDVPGLLAAHGVEVTETEEDTGIIYLSRFFRLTDGSELPSSFGVIGGDLGYLKYGVFPGDDRTFSITFAVGTHDAELRRLLLHPDTFITAAAAITATAPYVDGRSEPITGVEVMGGLINRRRRFTDDEGRPLVLGFHALGDAHTATNPLYGRGCALAMVQAQLLADLLDAHDPARCGDRAVDGIAVGDDVSATSSHVARAIAYEQALQEQVIPWYNAAVRQDRVARDAADAARRTAEEPSGETEHAENGVAPEPDTEDGFVDPAELVRSLLRDGLLPALKVDPVVLRAFLRMFNLLEPPDSLINDPDLIGRVMAVYQDRENRPPEPTAGPDRAGFLAAI